MQNLGGKSMQNLGGKSTQNWSQEQYPLAGRKCALGKVEPES